MYVFFKLSLIILLDFKEYRFFFLKYTAILFLILLRKITYKKSFVHYAENLRKTSLLKRWMFLVVICFFCIDFWFYFDFIFLSALHILGFFVGYLVPREFRYLRRLVLLSSIYSLWVPRENCMYYTWKFTKLLQHL